ncbi:MULTISPECIES: PadR family transcriptional regulator [Haloprofundus]|uniref:PadR family transcriptional regulator n=1 Tax=Haloprofundus TaxID=1911573 RepID=UPI000E448DBD|nr:MULTISPECIES: PadR family transcriptional regulator [Haloprofundus]
MHDLSGFQRDLLYVISGMDQPSGQQAKERLEQYLDDDINHGRLYPNLDTLVSKEYVEKGPIDRRTNYYAITERGENQIRERREWEESQFPFDRQTT